MAVLYANNARSTLAASITASQTSLTVTAGDGALFPAPTGSDVFYATLTDINESIREVVRVTARATDTLTVVRGQDGTGAQSWAADSKVELRLTKAMLDDFKTDARSGLLSGNQTVTLSGDVSGSGTTSITTTLANSGVSAGTYPKVTVDAKGRVTSGSSLASGDLPTYAGTLSSSQVTTALGYTPYNNTNPSGYISGINSANVTTALGFTPYNAANISQLFNNMGNNHNTYTDFNSVPNFGAYYVQAGTNSPTGVGAHQWYGFTLGLGNDYALSAYASQIYWPRAAQNSDTYLYVRDREGGTWGSWRKVRAGVADSVSSISSSQVTNALGFTPYNATNPSGYISSISSAQVTTALGFTPSSLPSQTNNWGRVLGTDGAATSWIPAAPTRPQGVVATVPSVAGRIDLSWNAVFGATEYRIYYNTTGNPQANVDAHIGTTSTSYAHTSLGAGMTFYYAIQARSIHGASDTSFPATSAKPNNPPSAPSISSASGASTSSVTVFFNTTGVQTGVPLPSYRIYYKAGSGVTSSDAFVDLTSAQASSGSYTVTGLAQGTYGFRVGAVNAYGTTLSGEVSGSPIVVTVYSPGQSFTATSGSAHFEANASVTSVRIELIGGAGGGGGGWNQVGAAGGAGGSAAGVYDLSQGRQMTYFVGSGGSGGCGYNQAGDGGGATAVVLLGTTNPLAVAGGGGGGGSGWNGTAGAGGAGGIRSNVAGASVGNGTAGATTQAAGGGGGSSSAGTNSASGTVNAMGTMGGRGGNSGGFGGGGSSGYGVGGSGRSTTAFWAGAGGGGGYFGGAGGWGSSAGDGGGGGSSYLAGSMSAFTQGLSVSSGGGGGAGSGGCGGAGASGTVRITFV